MGAISAFGGAVGRLCRRIFFAVVWSARRQFAKTICEGNLQRRLAEVTSDGKWLKRCA